MKRTLLLVIAAVWIAGPVNAIDDAPDYTTFEAYCAKINEVERAALTKAEVARLVDRTLPLLPMGKNALQLTQSLKLWKQFPYKLTVINQTLLALEQIRVSELASLRNTAAAHRAKTLEFLEAFQTEHS